jgi:hypothetical protein
MRELANGHAVNGLFGSGTPGTSPGHDVFTPQLLASPSWLPESLREPADRRVTSLQRGSTAWMAGAAIGGLHNGSASQPRWPGASRYCPGK